MRHAERRMGQTSWPAAGKCHIHMCEKPPGIAQPDTPHFLPLSSRWSHKSPRRREGTTRRQGGAVGGLPWPSLASLSFFFFLLWDTLPFTCAGVCVVRCACLRAAEGGGGGGSSSSSSSQHETVPYYVHIWLVLRPERPESAASFFTEWWPVKQVISGHDIFWHLG
ncbi:hypothetical protein CCMA1212_003792 [Trichoderma ghanense]|uniref:Uncharacterized protein n=1 Tax=Trichoderma ghanense TaxID=65468 RepID=A0ABY2H7X8_9HYPO